MQDIYPHWRYTHISYTKIYKGRCIYAWPCIMPSQLIFTGIYIVESIWTISKQSSDTCNPKKLSSWGQHEAYLGPVGPRWASCRPHEPCCQGCLKEAQRTTPVALNISWWSNQDYVLSVSVAICAATRCESPARLCFILTCASWLLYFGTSCRIGNGGHRVSNPVC